MIETDLGPAVRTRPDWVKCGRCAELVYGKRFTRDLRVCPDCGDHARLTARQRLDQLLDPGSETPLTVGPTPPDPLGFVDSRPYSERLAEARAETGMDEAVLCARGTIHGRPVVVAAMDFRFMGGSLGCAVGALVTEAADESLRTRTPLLLVTASGGARMQEGVLSLMQMAKTASALAELHEAGVLVLSLITDPTYGGVAASFATLADVILIEPGARLGFAGPRVIEHTIGERLPTGFQTAEFLLEHGMVDVIVPRPALRASIRQFLALDEPREERPHDVPAETPAPPESSAHASDEGDPWEAVRLARHPARPTTLDYASRLLDDFHELHGDRIGADCPAVVGGIGRLDGLAVMLIGHQKGGDNLAERQHRKFGMATPAGFRKAARLMRLAAKLGLPVITLVDTPGANPGPDAERDGQAVAIAENLRLMARLPTPIVTVITGEGGSGGALALAVADRVLIGEHGVYSVISPEGCAAILWKDPSAVPAAAAALRMRPRELLRLGVVDRIVPEPPGGAHTDPGRAAALLRAALIPVVEELLALDKTRLLRERGERFRSFGVTPDTRAEGSAS
ncbi:acetyl-CoA carboxylase, carboxyltransferase subunit beta [Embleya sp. NPDC050154]|uniref:acetyl-CoA carboxylase, carboxyltransferase subunit beta n=1 Tax=Embleya sp. NPDC050154 TaxID=3363988 RepID=UPI0037A72F48